MGTRGYSDRDIEEHVLAEQIRRHEARIAAPEWVLQFDEWTETLGGGVWRQVERKD